VIVGRKRVGSPDQVTVDFIPLSFAFFAIAQRYNSMQVVRCFSKHETPSQPHSVAEPTVVSYTIAWDCPILENSSNPLF